MMFYIKCPYNKGQSGMVVFVVAVVVIVASIVLSSFSHPLVAIISPEVTRRGSKTLGGWKNIW